MRNGGNLKSVNILTTFKLQVQYTSQEYYHYMTTHKNDDLKQAHTHFKKEIVTQGYPEDRITHPEGDKGSLKDIFRRNNH